jgi:hypothetical protein
MKKEKVEVGVEGCLVAQMEDVLNQIYSRDLMCLTPE